MLDGILHNRDTLEGAVVRDVRLPRAASGIIAGGALAAAAVLLIAITRNPLAEPATLGLTAGGTLAVTLTTAYASVAPGAPTIAIAFVGVLFGALLIGAIAAVAGAAPVRIVLAGMAISLALAAVSAAIQLLRETETSGMFLWGAGSLLQAGWDQVRPGAIIGVVVLAACFAIARQLDVAVLGESTARALGLRSGATRLLAVGAAVLLTAVAVGVAGPIAFVGILSAAVARSARPGGHAAQLRRRRAVGRGDRRERRRRRAAHLRPGLRDAGRRDLRADRRAGADRRRAAPARRRVAGRRRRRRAPRAGARAGSSWR